MKKIGIIISLLLIFILTGCQKEYKLTIKDDEIIEEINAIVPDTEENNEKVIVSYFPLHAVNDVAYNKKIKKENDMLNFHLDYTYKPKQFVNSNLLNTCFPNKEVIVDEPKYYYFNLEKYQCNMGELGLDVIIITDNRVLKNNADKVHGNKYIWHLSEENKDSFKLEIKIAKGKKRINVLEIIIVSLAIILPIIMTIYILKKRKKTNSI